MGTQLYVLIPSKLLVPPKLNANKPYCQHFIKYLLVTPKDNIFKNCPKILEM